MRADDPAVRAAALELARALAAEDGSASNFLELAGRRAFVKASRLTGRARLRWTLAAWCLRAPMPREREHANLLWLRTRLFLAPEPLASVVGWRAGAPCFQMLATRAVDGAKTLERHLREAGATQHAQLLADSADEIARMHALHFVHRDLYPRNVLVRSADSGGRIWFLDCWKGGERLQARGPEYDLACFLLRAPEWIGAEAQRAFLDRYLEQRAVQGSPVAERARFTARIEHERAALVTRLLRRPHETRGDGAPIADWRVE